MIVPNREGKCCDAVIRHIERSRRTLRKNVVDPERTGGTARVDLQVTVGDQVYALEHTRIQPFKDRIDMATQYRRIRDSVNTWFCDPLPGPAFYELHIPAGVHPPGRGKVGKQRLASLRDWIKKSMAALDVRAPGRPRSLPDVYFMDSESGKPCGWRCEFTLARSNDAIVYSLREAGSFRVYIGNPNDPKRLFTDELRKAPNKKCPKLAQCKEEVDGIRTILVLEVIQPPFGYDQYISECLPSLIEKCPTPPDDIFLVCPASFPFWQVWVIKHGENHWPDERMPMPHKGYHSPQPVHQGYPPELAAALATTNPSPEIPAEWEPYFPAEDELTDLKPAK